MHLHRCQERKKKQRALEALHKQEEEEALLTAWLALAECSFMPGAAEASQAKESREGHVCKHPYQFHSTALEHWIISLPCQEKKRMALAEGRTNQQEAIAPECRGTNRLG